MDAVDVALDQILFQEVQLGSREGFSGKDRIVLIEIEIAVTVDGALAECGFRLPQHAGREPAGLAAGAHGQVNTHLFLQNCPHLQEELFHLPAENGGFTAAALKDGIHLMFMDDAVDQKDLTGGTDLVKHIFDCKPDQFRVPFAEMIFTAFFFYTNDPQKEPFFGGG